MYRLVGEWTNCHWPPHCWKKWLWSGSADCTRCWDGWWALNRWAGSSYPSATTNLSGTNHRSTSVYLRGLSYCPAVSTPTFELGSWVCMLCWPSCQMASSYAERPYGHTNLAEWDSSWIFSFYRWFFCLFDQWTSSFCSHCAYCPRPCWWSIWWLSLFPAGPWCLCPTSWNDWRSCSGSLGTATVWAICLPVSEHCLPLRLPCCGFCGQWHMENSDTHCSPNSNEITSAVVGASLSRRLSLAPYFCSQWTPMEWSSRCYLLGSGLTMDWCSSSRDFACPDWVFTCGTLAMAAWSHWPRWLSVSTSWRWIHASQCHSTFCQLSEWRPSSYADEPSTQDWRLCHDFLEVEMCHCQCPDAASHQDCSRLRHFRTDGVSGAFVCFSAGWYCWRARNPFPIARAYDLWRLSCVVFASLKERCRRNTVMDQLMLDHSSRPSTCWRWKPTHFVCHYSTYGCTSVQGWSSIGFGCGACPSLSHFWWSCSVLVGADSHDSQCVSILAFDCPVGCQCSGWFGSLWLYRILWRCPWKPCRWMFSLLAASAFPVPTTNWCRFSSRIPWDMVSSFWHRSSAWLHCSWSSYANAWHAHLGFRHWLDHSETRSRSSCYWNSFWVQCDHWSSTPGSLLNTYGWCRGSSGTLEHQCAYSCQPPSTVDARV